MGDVSPNEADSSPLRCSALDTDAFMAASAASAAAVTAAAAALRAAIDDRTARGGLRADVRRLAIDAAEMSAADGTEYCEVLI
jgi:hypothetical protein